MSRIYTFDTGKKSYHLEISKANPYVISAGSAGRIERMASLLDNPEVIVSDRKHVTVHGFYKNLPVTAFNTGMGPASVSITLPEIIEACDNPNMVILRLGTAGGLKPFLRIGDFVISSDVERAESTSDKIMGQGYKAASCPDVRNVLIMAATQLKLPFQTVYTGPTKTTDDIYFDALNDKTKDHENVLAVSMEFSVHCALRDRYNRDAEKNIKTGELLVISDNICKEGGNEDHVDMTEFLAHKHEIEKAHTIIGLETLLKISQRIKNE